MSKLYLGSIDVAKIKKELIVSKGKDGLPFKNGAKYLDVAIWVNDTPDQYGNHLSIKIGGKEDSIYLGNAKEYVKDGGNDVKKGGVKDDDDLPF